MFLVVKQEFTRHSRLRVMAMLPNGSQAFLLFNNFPPLVLANPQLFLQDSSHWMSFVTRVLESPQPHFRKSIGLASRSSC
jgi:hypothetical protein